ncbi:hypothetical protein [Candidatus Kuenenia stuttgartiensis]|uniref:hypothetical protein n=1 Tax=Kuenenia stuttgartiensis TaxID=174633 RepID=UPI00146A1CAF|nr:hypothetical protein [Candidatus Kuenenia stuttgartiensis]
MTLKYVCNSCGRIASKRDQLCNPAPLAKEKKKTGTTVTKKAVKTKPQAKSQQQPKAKPKTQSKATAKPSAKKKK